MAEPSIAFDYIIAGGGTAGCVLADRLTEDGRHQVLLIEGGHKGETFYNKIPAASFLLIGNPKFDWIFPVEPDASIMGREQNWTVGKLLGGETSINGMVYLRGLRTDFDDWAADGADGWGWDDLYPYFRKSENYVGKDNPPSHARGGPVRSDCEDFRACKCRQSPDFRETKVVANEWSDFESAVGKNFDLGSGCKVLGLPG